MKHKYLLAWMDCAERFAQTSEAKRLKVAAFLFKNGNMVSHAINGTPVGWPTNECEVKVYQSDEGGFRTSDYPFADNYDNYRFQTKDCVVHAEEQCLQKMWHSHETTDGCEMLITHSPCLKCSLKIKSAGIVKVYYRHEYRSSEGIEYLTANNIEVEKI